MVLTCVSGTITDDGHLSMYLFATVHRVWRNVCSVRMPVFKLFGCFALEWSVLSMYFRYEPFTTHTQFVNIFSVPQAPFHFVNCPSLCGRCSVCCSPTHLCLLVVCSLGVICKNSLLRPTQQVFSRNLTVSGCTCRSLTYFELIFVCSVR